MGRSLSEASIAEVVRSGWRIVLNNKDLDEDSNFFLLGGDSLLGMMLVSYICDRLKVSLELESVYKYPTLGSMISNLVRSFGQS